MKNQGSHLYAETEVYAIAIDTTLKKQFPKQQLFALTGQFRRQVEIIDRLEWVTTATDDRTTWPSSGANNYTTKETLEDIFSVLGPENVLLKFYRATPESFNSVLFQTSGSEDFITACQALPGWSSYRSRTQSEEDIF